MLEGDLRLGDVLIDTSIEPWLEGVALANAVQPRREARDVVPADTVEPAP